MGINPSQLVGIDPRLKRVIPTSLPPPPDEAEECSADLYNDLIYERNQMQMESCPTELDEKAALSIVVAESMVASSGVSKSVGEARATLSGFCALHSCQPGG